MPQQRSLFSFYSRGAATYGAKPTAFLPSPGIDPSSKSATMAGSRADESAQQDALMERLRQKFTRPSKEKDAEEPLERIQQEFVGNSKDKAVEDHLSFQVVGTSKEKAPEGLVERIQKTPARFSQSVTEKPVERIQQKLDRLSKENGVDQLCPASASTGPRIPGFKRVREAEVCSSASDSEPVNEKRAKLLEALGVDDCSPKSVAWEAAKARFEWMTPSKIRDANGRRPGDPLYDARTLDVPDDVFRKLSASQKQYWATKSRYMDTLLFFKVGSFYELYELDAEIGHRELDWKLTVSGVGKCRQVGCPESRIDETVMKLVSRGYKVGRMEQIETAAQAKKRGGVNPTVQRELTHVCTPSTMMDGNIRPEAVHLLALKEEMQTDDMSDNSDVRIGFSFVDAAVGRFYVGSIFDDCSRSALLTLLTQVAPQEVLYEMGGTSDATRRALRRSPALGFLPLVLTPLQPNVEFMEPADALEMFRSHHYFQCGKDTDQCFNESQPWMSALESVEEKDLSISSLGALVCHLTRIKCDDELLPNGVLSSYEIYKGSLRLDGQTVDNLELLQNRINGGKEGTLMSYLDNCVSQFGKRLLRRWICHPLRSIGDIEYRLDGVEDLRSSSEVAAELRAGLRKLPDLERLVARLSGLSAAPMLGMVPMAAKKVHQRRLKAFCSTVFGMRAASDLLLCLKNLLSENEHLNSKVLQVASTLADSDPVRTCLERLESAIDQSSKSPKLVCQEQDPFHTDKDVDEIHVEARMLSKLMGVFNQQRLHWLRIVDMLAQLDVLISFAAASSGSNGTTCRPQFIASQGLKKGGAVLDMKGLWHPYATGGQGGAVVPNDLELGNYSGSKPSALLLTGPNMGGKSTLLRATCLAVIMGQLGCFVPCESCTMSPVDTIFTRLGASDHIVNGESTFMVECTEAASVLHHATSDSLVVLDELGRGTSTFDGYAIAYAVFHDLVNTLNCRLMFATHYQPLTEEFASNPFVRLGHMTCSFLPDSNLLNSSTSKPGKGDSVLDKQLVFLYKLADGICPKSYGLQVALLAGIPISIVRSAENMGALIQERLSQSFATREWVFEQEQIVKAVSAALNFMPSDSSTAVANIYQELLRMWQELRKEKKFAL